MTYFCVREEIPFGERDVCRSERLPSSPLAGIFECIQANLDDSSLYLSDVVESAAQAPPRSQALRLRGRCVSPNLRESYSCNTSSRSARPSLRESYSCNTSSRSARSSLRESYACDTRSPAADSRAADLGMAKPASNLPATLLRRLFAPGCLTYGRATDATRVAAPRDRASGRATHATRVAVPRDQACGRATHATRVALLQILGRPIWAWPSRQASCLRLCCDEYSPLAT